MIKPSKEVEYSQCVAGASVFLVCDLGGTNCNFGLFTHNGSLTLARSLHFKSQEINDFSSCMSDVVAYTKNIYGLKVTAACIAFAGVVRGNIAKPTNVALTIDIEAIKAATGLSTVILANDFEVIGSGLPLIDQSSIVPVLPGAIVADAPKAIIGAGTGLGKSIMVFEETQKNYYSLPSEGGHADFASQSEIEVALVHFIQKLKQNKKPVSWEEVLSGTGIKRIYAFYKSKHDGTVDIQAALQDLHPDEIFAARNRNSFCWDTYQLYARIYGRCAKNFFLETLAYGGVYIAGGIAAKNLALFQHPEFSAEFFNNEKHQTLLRQAPVFVITDYNVSLYGAAEFLRLHCKC